MPDGAKTSAPPGILMRPRADDRGGRLAPAPSRLCHARRTSYLALADELQCNTMQQYGTLGTFL